jgi:hypothetical protein
MITSLSFSRPAFIAALLLFAGGCAYEPIASPDRRSAQFGDDVNAVFRVGISSRDAVFSKFGRPSYSTQRDLACGYLFAAKTGRAKGLLMGPCFPYFGATDITELDDVWLEFDDSGVLKRIEKHLVARSKNNSESAWRAFAAPVPDKIRAEQMVGGRT